jgi:hypothetical protein
MNYGKPSDSDHSATERWLDNTITHAYDEQKEEGERVAEGIENAHQDYENLGSCIITVPVSEIWFWVSAVQYVAHETSLTIIAPGHEHLYD